MRRSAGQSVLRTLAPAESGRIFSQRNHLRTALRVTMTDSDASSALDPSDVRVNRRWQLIFKRVFQLSSLFFLIKGLAWLALAWWAL